LPEEEYLMMTRTIPLRSLVYASMFGALTAIGAYISIPFLPVPLTLQTLFTILAGLLLGGPLAALSQLVYVLLGVIGLPVFAGGKAGLGVLLGPTGGYLLGFILGAYVIGALANSRKNAGPVWLFVSIVAGHVIIYGLGVLQLSLIAHLSAAKAIVVGVIPFLPSDALKCAASILVSLKIAKEWRMLGRPAFHD
jgi:biotin transport system substrate-specific component